MCQCFLPQKNPLYQGKQFNPNCLNWSPQRVPLSSQKWGWAWCLWTWLSRCRISRTPTPQGTVLGEAPLENTFPSNSLILPLLSAWAASAKPCVRGLASWELQWEQRVSVSASAVTQPMPDCSLCHLVKVLCAARLAASRFRKLLGRPWNYNCYPSAFPACAKKLLYVLSNC